VSTAVRHPSFEGHRNLTVNLQVIPVSFIDSGK